MGVVGCGTLVVSFITTLISSALLRSLSMRSCVLLLVAPLVSLIFHGVSSAFPLAYANLLTLRCGVDDCGHVGKHNGDNRLHGIKVKSSLATLRHVDLIGADPRGKLLQPSKLE